jgi:hypothetical protein
MSLNGDTFITKTFDDGSKQWTSGSEKQTGLGSAESEGSTKLFVVALSSDGEVSGTAYEEDTSFDVNGDNITWSKEIKVFSRGEGTVSHRESGIEGPSGMSDTAVDIGEDGTITITIFTVDSNGDGTETTYETDPETGETTSKEREVHGGVTDEDDSSAEKDDSDDDHGDDEGDADGDNDGDTGDEHGGEGTGASSSYDDGTDGLGDQGPTRTLPKRTANALDDLLVTDQAGEGEGHDWGDDYRVGERIGRALATGAVAPPRFGGDSGLGEDTGPGVHLELPPPNVFGGGGQGGGPGGDWGDWDNWENPKAISDFTAQMIHALMRANPKDGRFLNKAALANKKLGAQIGRVLAINRGGG